MLDELPDPAHWDERFLTRHPSTQEKWRYFAFSHLPENLQIQSQACAALAYAMILSTKDGPQLTIGLQKLIEAKDAFVRAAL